MSKKKSKGRSGGGGKKKKARKFVPEYIGTAKMSREGFIFVAIDGQEEDVYVKASKTRGALNGDIVKVAVTQERDGQAKKRSGEIIAIVERSTKPFVGILHIVGRQAWVLMSSKTMPYDIEVPIPEGGVKGTLSSYFVLRSISFIRRIASARRLEKVLALISNVISYLSGSAASG